MDRWAARGLACRISAIAFAGRQRGESGFSGTSGSLGSLSASWIFRWTDRAWGVAGWDAFGDISPFEMGRMNYLRDQQNALHQLAEMICGAPRYEDIPSLHGMCGQSVPYRSTAGRFGVAIPTRTLISGVRLSADSRVDRVRVWLLFADR